MYGANYDRNLPAAHQVRVERDIRLAATLPHGGRHLGPPSRCRAVLTGSVER